MRTDLAGKAIFYIEGFKEAGDCPVHSVAGGLVIISVPESEDFSAIFSMALMAYSSGKEVKISIDDSQKDALGRCNLTMFRLNKNF